jgi:hypothetical protein
MPGGALVAGHVTFRCVIVAEVTNTARAEHHVRLDLSQSHDRIAQFRPDRFAEPHIEANHVDSAVVAQQLCNLLAGHHPRDVSRVGISNSEPMVCMLMSCLLKIDGS